MSKKKSAKVVAPQWVPSTPIRLKVVSEGWGCEIGCPHCKEVAESLIVRTKEGLDIWWLCDCGEGISIEQAYKNVPGEHTSSLGYYLNVAWKMQERVWPLYEPTDRD